MGILMKDGHLLLQDGKIVSMDQEKFEECCCGTDPLCACECPEGQEVVLAVTIAGVTGSTSCTAYNKTHYLTGGECNWSLQAANTCCPSGEGGYIINLSVVITKIGDDWTLIVTAAMPGGDVVWSTVLAEDFDCVNLSESLDLDSSASTCGTGSATCSVASFCSDALGPCQWFRYAGVPEPDTVEVTISNVISRTTPGCSCTDLNGTYYLSKVSSCDWQYSFPTAVCGVTGIRFRLYCGTSIECDTCYMAVGFVGAGGSNLEQIPKCQPLTTPADLVFTYDWIDVPNCDYTKCVANQGCGGTGRSPSSCLGYPCTATVSVSF